MPRKDYKWGGVKTACGAGFKTLRMILEPKMEAKIGKLLDSVGNFFTGADQIPWCDGDIVAVSAFPTLNSIWVSDFVLSLFFFLGIEFRLDFGFFCGFFFFFLVFFFLDVVFLNEFELPISIPCNQKHRFLFIFILLLLFLVDLEFSVFKYEPCCITITFVQVGYIFELRDVWFMGKYSKRSEILEC